MPALSPLLLLPPVPGSRLQGGLQVGTNMGLGTSYLSATLDLTAQRGARVVNTAKGCSQALCEPLTQPAHLGEALSKNPGYIKLRKIRAAQNISKTIATSQNRIYLTADNLVLNLQDESFTRGSDSLIKSKK